ncbi:MAG: hypothetical protein ACYC2K_09810 [Gemmatimonadales bacterium]
MTTRPQGRLVLVLGLIFSLPIVGAALGGIVASVAASGMGWDRIGDVLGGLMIGGVFGLITAVVLVRRGSAVWVRRTAVLSLGLAFAVLAYLAWRLSSSPSS